MLPKRNRLKKRSDIEAVFKKGKSIKQDFLFLRILRNNLKISRFGFMVSKKISKKATIRNKVRRRFGEIIRTNLFEIKKGWDGVIIACPGIEKKKFKETEENIKRILRKAQIF